MPRLGIGTAALAVPYGPPGEPRRPPDRAAAVRTLLAALERGVRFIDTAPAYGQAEELVGAALHRRADCDDCILATKLAIPPAGWSALSPAQIRAHVRSSAHASLRALRRERLDLLQVHNANRALIRDGAVVAALAELRAQGLVRSLGATVYREDDALAAIGDPALEVLQIPYSALDRRPERRVLPAAAIAGTALVARSLLLHGVLSPAARELHGPFAPLADAADALRRAFAARWDELPGAAVAYVLHRPGIDRVLIGPRDEAELHALLDQAARFGPAAARLELAAPALPEWLLDPSRWSAEATVGG